MVNKRKIILLTINIALTVLAITIMLIGRFETIAEVQNTFTITYKDVGGGSFSGTLGYNTPTEHRYGTETVL
ncbi:MAG: hypothetical protein FWE36_03490, partial [Erysipelotrichales bacterium]|nr:hypothetical protein [Erysipelotrichales bacterium]